MSLSIPGARVAPGWARVSGPWRRANPGVRLSFATVRPRASRGPIRAGARRRANPILGAERTRDSPPTGPGPRRRANPGVRLSFALVRDRAGPDPGPVERLRIGRHSDCQRPSYIIANQRPAAFSQSAAGREWSPPWPRGWSGCRPRSGAGATRGRTDSGIEGYTLGRTRTPSQSGRGLHGRLSTAKLDRIGDDTPVPSGHLASRDLRHERRLRTPLATPRPWRTSRSRSSSR